MMVQVREYARLTCDRTQTASMDSGVISEATFSWLEQLQQQWGGSTQLLNREGKRFLRLANYVGYLEAPNGESIEILPKTTLTTPTDPVPLRQLLRRMLSASLGITPREASQAVLQRSNLPLSEWILSEFLRHLAELVRRGLRSDYQQVEDEHSAFIRGQLNVAAQMRKPPGTNTRFYVRYAEFSPQRIENRLLRTALDRVLKVTKEAQNWRQANTLRHQLDSIVPLGGNTAASMKQWRDGKYLYDYRAIKPWCQLILDRLNPDFQCGLHQGISLLFPMEKLYERWVGSCLASTLLGDYRLITQARQHCLLDHQPAGEETAQQWFRLKPDFLIKGEQVTVLDAKWKLLDSRANSRKVKYHIDQADLYQMFAYGQKYLHGKGNMMLIYPRHHSFATPLPVFRFDAHLSLWCVPFDLETGELVKSEWQDSFHCFPGETAITIADD